MDNFLVEYYYLPISILSIVLRTLYYKLGPRTASARMVKNYNSAKHVM